MLCSLAETFLEEEGAMLRAKRASLAAALATALALTLGAGSAGASNGARTFDRTLDPGTRFFVPGFEPAALRQWVQLLSHGARRDAELIRDLESVSHGVWVTGGTTFQTRLKVQLTTVLAAAMREVPVLVAYNIPGRDCGGFSAGGAQTTVEYEVWVDAFAAGIGNRKAVVIVEPDGLGLLPSNCGGPNAGYPFTDAERYTELNYAVDRLEQQPQVIVYLDGTHSAWLNVHDASTRLIQGGVQRAQGFFLNVSNYQYTPNLVNYGTWISKCIARITGTPSSDDCPDQYWNGGPHPALIADLLGEWTGVALSRYGQWSDTTTTPELNTSGENVRYSTTTGATHFVIDTSRNGQGHWTPPADVYPDAQDWCNPPGRGLGVRATTNTGSPLGDALLWVKVPGESDGTCTRGAPAGSVDPEWGLVDPAAGQWFPQQALQLAQLASPPAGLLSGLRSIRPQT
jgi:endoglucanase